MTTTITITPSTTPPGKVADAELHFATGILDGLKMIGFAVWQRRGGSAGYNVTFPARQYSVNGERRSFSLLRPSAFDTGMNPQDRIRDLGIDAYKRTEQHPTV